MLAEQRRKQKFGSDPRNTFWSNDENKFGQRMLEKMGWKQGKGLGANEDGRTQHVSTVFKARDDVRGVGCTKKHADTWIAHQDDFNALLQALNQEQVETSEAGDGNSYEPSVLGLEAKSKSSRKRVHYHKWTRGKDLSSKSVHDLNCIFGRSTQSSSQNTPDQSGGSSDEEKSQQSVLSVSDSASNTAHGSEPGRVGGTDHGVVTVTSSSSIQEYFAQKMLGIGKQKGAGAGFLDVVCSKHSRQIQDAGMQMDATGSHIDDNSENTDISASLPKKKKKKKCSKNEADEESTGRKNRHNVDEMVSNNLEVAEQPTELIAGMGTEQTALQTDTRKTKKKKEKKKQKCEANDDVEENIKSDNQNEASILAVQKCITPVNSECRCESSCFGDKLKKKKSKKHSKKAKEVVADAGPLKQTKRVRFSLEWGEMVGDGSKQDLNQEINRKETDNMEEELIETEITKVEHSGSEHLAQSTNSDSIASDSVSKKRKKKEKKERRFKKMKNDWETVQSIGKADSTDTKKMKRDGDPVQSIGKADSTDTKKMKRDGDPVQSIGKADSTDTKKMKRDGDPVQSIGKADSTDTVGSTAVPVSQNGFGNTTKHSVPNKRNHTAGTIGVCMSQKGFAITPKHSLPNKRTATRISGKNPKNKNAPRSGPFPGSNLSSVQGYGSK